MRPSRLSEQLRNDDSSDLRRRRWIVGLSMVGAAMAQIVSLYQMGIVKRLPSIPGRLFNATKVDASDYAYKRLATPDGIMMLATYSFTAWLAAAGGRDRARQTPALPVALALKTIYDVVNVVRLGREEWQENHALCDYCQTASLASVASAALAMPEAVSAIRHLRARH